MSQKKESAPEVKSLNRVIKIDEARIHSHLDEMVRDTVEDTPNKLLEAEADRLCNAQRYEHTEARGDTRAGSYRRKLHTKAGEVNMKVPRLRKERLPTVSPTSYLDGLCLKRSWGGEVRNVSILVAVGVDEQGYREILGICEGAKEDQQIWSHFLRHLKQRGLKGIQWVISDKCLGLLEAVVKFYPDAQWQRCVCHWYRNVFSVVPTDKVKSVVAMLKAIHAQQDRQAALEKAQAVSR